MDKVRISKEKLLAAVHQNRQKHIAEYEEACQGYCQDAVKEIAKLKRELTEQIKRLEHGEVFRVEQRAFRLPVPLSHAEDYDRVIQMLEMSADEVIELDVSDFSRYVRDDWEWQRAFKETISSYNNKAGR